MKLAKIDFKRILIVEKDHEFRQSLFKVFEKAGYEVTAATDESEANGFMSNLTFPLIFLDVKTDEQSPSALVKRIKKRNPDSKVVVFTTSRDLPACKKTNHSDLFVYLNKPAKRQDILRCARLAFQDLTAQL